MTTKEKSLVSVKEAPTGAGKRWSGKTKQERSDIMSGLATRRWEGVAKNDAELREHFTACSLDEALETYALMRKQYETAGEILNTRVQAERNLEQCANCGAQFSRDVPWYNRDPVKDPATSIITNVFACSQACLIAIRGSGKPLHRRF